MLLSALALTLLAAAVESTSSSGGGGNFNYYLSGSELTRLYNSPVLTAEWMTRLLDSKYRYNPARLLMHTGVRVTLEDRSQWLIHKGNNIGIDSQTVVTRADDMSPNWKRIISREFNGRKTVSDFVKTGGETYNLLFNCHIASGLMMLQ